MLNPRFIRPRVVHQIRYILSQTEIFELRKKPCTLNIVLHEFSNDFGGNIVSYLHFTHDLGLSSVYYIHTHARYSHTYYLYMADISKTSFSVVYVHTVQERHVRLSEDYVNNVFNGFLFECSDKNAAIICRFREQVDNIMTNTSH